MESNAFYDPNQLPHVEMRLWDKWISDITNWIVLWPVGHRFEMKSLKSHYTNDYP